MTTLPDEDEITARLAMVRGVVLGTSAGVHMRRTNHATRVGLIVGASAVGVLGLTAGTIAVVNATQDQISYSVNCYSADSLTSSYTTVQSPTATNSATGQTDRAVTDPVTTCTDMWRMGLIGQSTKPADPNSANFPVPDLVACALSNGVGAGFPRTDSTISDKDLCDSLGLAVWSR
jgi:hypothetical protein